MRKSVGAGLLANAAGQVLRYLGRIFFAGKRAPTVDRAILETIGITSPAWAVCCVLKPSPSGELPTRQVRVGEQYPGEFRRSPEQGLASAGQNAVVLRRQFKGRVQHFKQARVQMRLGHGRR